VSVRWKIRKKIMQGRIPSSPDALCAVIFTPYCPWLTARASGTVWFAFDGKRIKGRKNSFHVQMKKNTNNTESVGILSGATIYLSRPSLLHPSVRAASIISRGNVVNDDDNKYVPNEL
jgi:hypothetical protein